MKRAWSLSEMDYPEADGQPMGETPLHQAWIIRLLNQLQQRYRAQPQVYVASDLLVYPLEGNTREVFVPDLIVLLESDRRERRVLKLWEESHPPNFVMEITSRSTRSSDAKDKHSLYARLGIAEYFLYDPTHQELSPPLQGYRLHGPGDYQPIEPDTQGRLASEQLGITFSLEPAAQLVLRDLHTGDVLLTDVEAERLAGLRATAQERQRRERAEQLAYNAEQRVEAERQARLQAETRVAELEAELSRLRDGQNPS